MSGIDAIKNKIMVLSGKGGVGKSSIAVNTAVALKNKGYKVGLLDIDLHGPSIPHMLGLQNETLNADKDNKLIPVEKNGLKVISIGFLLDDDNRAVIWRGPLKYKLLMQFLNDVEWGELDYLIIDSPPGTGDEPLTILQNIKDLNGAVIVTSPQDIALLDVKKAMDFLNQMSVPVIGLVENMSGYKCPECGEISHIFGRQNIEEKLGSKVITKIPIMKAFVELSDSGRVPAEINEEIKIHFEKISQRIIDNTQ